MFYYSQVKGFGKKPFACLWNSLLNHIKKIFGFHKFKKAVKAYPLDYKCILFNFGIVGITVLLFMLFSLRS